MKKLVNGVLIDMTAEEIANLPRPATEAEALFEARATMTLTFAQLLIGLVAEGWITEAEGESWLDGQLPAALATLIAGLPSPQRFAATARAKRPSVVLRSDPLVNALAQMQGRAPAQMDAFFINYAGV